MENPLTSSSLNEYGSVMEFCSIFLKLIYLLIMLTNTNECFLKMLNISIVFLLVFVLFCSIETVFFFIVFV